jgi:alpha-glucosidase
MMTRLALLSLAALACLPAPAQTLRSPNGELAVSLEPASGAPAARLAYSIQLRGKPLVVSSRLGLRLKPGPSLDGNVRVVKIAPSTADSTWTPVWGERASIRDHYHQWQVDLEAGDPARRFQLLVRAYDHGVAFRYVIPTQPGLDECRVTEELTEFRLPQDGPAFATYTAQGVYEKVPLSQSRPGCERPLVVEPPGGPVMAWGEAALVDFARMKFQPVGEDQPGVRARLDGAATGRTPIVTPWRFVLWADTPAQLLERNDLILNLNEPNALTDVSWIRPGTVLRSGLSTEAGMACVDFAASNGLRFVLFDAGWYGPERDKTSDPTRIAHPDQLDLPAVIAHGKQHGIGVILYVNRIAAERQLDEMLPLYRQWGVAGVKYGFVRVGSQDATAWVHHAVRAAAAHQLMVDVHDEYRMTGYSRTYPHFMTAEGIGGDETQPAARDNVNLAFTRMLAGPADHTFCWMDPRIRNTHAHQLALPVVFFSPGQVLYW